MIASLTAGAFATEIPTISLDLAGNAFKHTHTTTSDMSKTNTVDSTANSFARRCHVKTDTPADCPSPTASAHDHHDGTIAVDSIVVTATQFVKSEAGQAPVQVNTDLGAAGVEQFTGHKGLATAYYQQRGEFVLSYNVKDANNNPAEELVFAMIMVDEVAPTITSGAETHTVEACSETSGMRCMVGGFTTAQGNDAYDGVLTGSKFTYAMGGSTKNVDGNTIEVDVQGTPAAHDIVFTATDFANIFGAGNTDNVATKTVTITAVDNVAPRVYLSNAATGAAAIEENVCSATTVAGVTTIPQCLQHNMRKVVNIGSYASGVAACAGCKGGSCFTAGSTACTAVEATMEKFECGVAAPASLFGSDNKALASGAFGVDDRQSASTSNNNNDESVLTVTVGADTFDNMNTASSQTFTYTTTATGSVAAAQSASKTRTIMVQDTTDPVLKITHLGHKDLTRDSTKDYHAHDSQSIDTTKLTATDPLADLYVIQHSAGYVQDVQYINGLTTAGVGWQCDDTCKGDHTATDGSLTHENDSTQAAYSTAEWYKSEDCAGSTVAEFKTLEVGKWSIKYTCTDGVNTVTACRNIKNEDHAKPIITILEGDQDTYEATKEDNYVDAGATCQDEVDGNISQDVEVSGDVVNLARVGTYQIFYNCKDSAQNEADPATRTVIVQDTLCPTCTIEASAKELEIEASFTFTDSFATDVTCTDELQETITPVATTYSDEALTSEFTTEISKTVGTYYIAYVATDSVGNSNAGANSCKVKATDANGQPKADYTRKVVVKDTLVPVIKLSLGGSVIKEGAASASTAADFDASNPNPAVAGTKHWLDASLMAEESSTTAVNGWVMGAVASAVSGLALLGYSLRRGAAPVATSVPV